MTKEQSLTIGKANVYRLLSACYYQPCPEMKLILENLEDWLKQVFPVGEEDAAAMKQEMERKEDAVDKLTIEYARLFVGPFSVPAPPYGSVYLEEGHRVMGDTTAAVRRFYGEAGLELSEQQKDLPDHIAVELEFLYYLLCQGYDDKYKIFLEKFVAPWMDGFTDAVEANTHQEFYRRLARLTRNFVAQEVEYLSSINEKQVLLMN